MNEQWGRFTGRGAHYIGVLHTLTMDRREVRLEETSTTGPAPGIKSLFRVVYDNIIVGEAWVEDAKTDGKERFWLMVDDPTFRAPAIGLLHRDSSGTPYDYILGRDFLRPPAAGPGFLKTNVLGYFQDGKCQMRSLCLPSRYVEFGRYQSGPEGNDAHRLSAYGLLGPSNSWFISGIKREDLVMRDPTLAGIEFRVERTEEGLALVWNRVPSKSAA